MSNNHPNDNIYNILGKLDALKPTPEEKRMSLVKEIQASVDAKGSITEGVSSIESKLRQQFDESVAEVAPPGAKAERMVKGIKQSLSKDGHLSGKDKAIAYATTWKAHNKGQVEESHCSTCDCEPCECPTNESTCNECGMYESKCSCDHTNEAEITRKPGVTTHRKTDFPGYPVDDINADDNEPKGRGRPRKHAKKEPTGLGRGRPKKAAAVGSTAPKMHDPFGRVAHSASKLNGGKGRVHSLDEAMKLIQENLTEGRCLEDGAGVTLNHILNRYRAEVKTFEQGGDLDRDLYDALYDYYVECGEMPYGVQKARTDDPMNWVSKRLDVELGNIAYGKDPANAEAAEGIEMEAGIPGNVPPEQIPGKEDLLKGKGRSYYEEETTMETELNELARLAGLGEVSRGDYIKQQDTKAERSGKEEFNAFGQLFNTDEIKEEPNEGNAFTAGLEDDDVKIGDKIPGTDAIKTKDIDAVEEDKIDVEDAEEVANTPKPEYQSIKAITTQGDDLNRQKRQFADKPKLGDNPMATLEAKLAAEYESIKKVS